MSYEKEEAEPEPQAEESCDDLAHQACYIFQPIKPDPGEIDDRPKKRQKLTTPQSNDDIALFPRLFGGKESRTSAERRRDTFQQIWSHQQDKIDKIVAQVDEGASRDIDHFMKQSTTGNGNGGLHTGLVLAGPDIGMQDRLLEHWKEMQTTRSRVRLIQFDSSSSPNLQVILKNIIKTTISQSEGEEGYQSFLAKHKRLIPMNFDLELLQLFTDENKLEQIVISILNVETFDMGVMSDLISSLSSWADRVNFVVFLGIATTVELFESYLPKSIVRLLNTKVFDVSARTDGLYDIFSATQGDEDVKVWLGPAASKILLDMTEDQGATAECFTNVIKYAYMSHFFANPLSVLVANSDPEAHEDLTEICEAIRNTDSFRGLVEDCLNTGKLRGAQKVVKLFKDDEFLLLEARDAVAQGQEFMVKFHNAIRAFKELRSLLNLNAMSGPSSFEIDLETISGKDFMNSHTYADTITALSKLHSDRLYELLDSFCLAGNGPHADSYSDIMSLNRLQSDLLAFQTQNSKLSIRSGYDPSHQTATTTITKNNTVSISKHAAKLTPAETNYTRIVDKIVAELEEYFSLHLQTLHFRNCFMHEAFVFDLRAPLSGAFNPKPRYAIERALEKPGDYLSCSCCARDGAEESADRGSGALKPATSALWQLWCEAGGVVNVRDLWGAFKDLMAPERESGEAARQDGGEMGRHEDEDEDEGEDQDQDQDADVDVDAGAETDSDAERRALALFYRGLAELRTFGLIKSSKKKPGVECLAKTVWSGL